MAEKGTDFPTEVKEDLEMLSYLTTSDEGTVLDVSPADAKRVLRKIDFW